MIFIRQFDRLKSQLSHGLYPPLGNTDVM